MQVNDGNKGGLNELLAAMLHSENKDIPYHELNELLHRIEDDATEIYYRKYCSNDTKIEFNINSNEKGSDFAPLGRQSAKSIECISKYCSVSLFRSTVLNILDPIPWRVGKEIESRMNW